MALTGHLSDLSLSELIEFFCNQRKSGQLKVLYPKGAGYFYLQSGSVVDARIGQLHGIDAVYYALTLPNAEFEFSADTQSVHRSINQPWTQVVLEGLRRLDEGISPSIAFPPGYVAEAEEDQISVENEDKQSIDHDVHNSSAPAFFSFVGREAAGRRKPMFVSAIAVAVLASVAAIGVPAGWYNAKKVERSTEAASTTPTPQTDQVEPSATAQPTSETSPRTEDDAASLAARRQREKDKKARDARSVDSAPVAVAPKTSSTEVPKPGPKRVVVTVTYDESGRVTQASGGDANALRIARQKRFPPGKPGSATVTIPIN